MLALYMDEDSQDDDLAAALRSHGFDVLRTVEVGRRSAPDDDQLAYAFQNDRIIVTANARDYVRLHRERVTGGRPHGGIVIRIQQLSVGTELRAFEAIAQRYTQESFRNQLEYLNNWLQHQD